MNILSELNQHLILDGAKITGTFTEGYQYSEESFYVNEAEEIYQFCKWIDVEVGGASRYNIVMLWDAFKNPGNKSLQKQKNELKDTITKLHNLIK